MGGDNGDDGTLVAGRRRFLKHQIIVAQLAVVELLERRGRLCENSRPMGSAFEVDGGAPDPQFARRALGRQRACG